MKNDYLKHTILIAGGIAALIGYQCYKKSSVSVAIDTPTLGAQSNAPALPASVSDASSTVRVSATTIHVSTSVVHISDQAWADIVEQYEPAGFKRQYPNAIRCETMTWATARSLLNLDESYAKPDEAMETLADTLSYIWYKTGIFFRVMANVRSHDKWVKLSDGSYFPDTNCPVAVELFHTDWRPPP